MNSTADTGAKRVLMREFMPMLPLTVQGRRGRDLDITARVGIGTELRTSALQLRIDD